MKKILAALAALAMLFGIAACSDNPNATREDQLKNSQVTFDSRTPPDVTGDAEYQNYIRAQEEIYDDPASIIWCTVFPESPSSPIFTVPIAGKLTSSSVSYFPNHQVFDEGEGNGILVESQSVDGMYHGSPPPYRYGFTPGGQYVDFFNLPTFCTTALTEFQRQTLSVALSNQGDADRAQTAAEEALASGDEAKAQELLDDLVED